MRNAAEAIAALLRTDRNAALRFRHEVFSEVDVDDGVVRAGSSGRTVELPRGVKLQLVQSGDVMEDGKKGIRFLAGGQSSGGALTLSRPGYAYRISVNWLTAGVRIERVGADG